MWEGHNWLPVILQEANLGVLVATSSLQEWYAVSEKLKKVRPFAMTYYGSGPRGDDGSSVVLSGHYPFVNKAERPA